MLKISSNSQVQNTFESLKVCSCLFGLFIREQVVAVDDEDAESYVVALRRVHHQLSLLIHLKCFKLLLHPVWGPQKLPLGLRRLAYMQSRRCNGCLAVPALGEISRVTGVAKRQIVGDAITNSHSWHLNPHVVEVPRSSLALTAPR